MANLDISSKLGKEQQTITIAEGLSYEVDCRCLLYTSDAADERYWV